VDDSCSLLSPCRPSLIPLLAVSQAGSGLAPVLAVLLRVGAWVCPLGSSPASTASSSQLLLFVSSGLCLFALLCFRVLLLLPVAVSCLTVSDLADTWETDSDSSSSVVSAAPGWGQPSTRAGGKSSALTMVALNNHNNSVAKKNLKYRSRSVTQPNPDLSRLNPDLSQLNPT
jgi:hypothetical protein